ncbi:two-component system sensor histidine kinase KdpD [Chitinivorax sp. B]|uniref:two-component system sensor histidine kinase KdpD n=1 Tax=Chitinivorax sp. B TaxID=2502235 RepID=UPI0010F5B339|nr:two-component system sensor histidine kinase KdpD [Chitinivorax sp. B]
MIDIRPDPDQLLDKIRQEEAKQQRGKLKIFFGASAGVGKTYTMLAAAQTLRQSGVDVVVGVVETHGRTETANMLTGMEVLPRKQIDYRGHTLSEFDIDAALVRNPQVILVDELAHSNLAGSRHPKRWQDVEELLAAGIDVYTSLNVQHLESLNDVVGQITQIRVYETLPDKVFDQADEILLVDLPAEELLQRLKEGKVYLPDQADRAVKHFFRKGNLIALRELALRRTADRVDTQMREYRADQSIHRVWQAKERLLVCLGPDDGAAVVRAAARLAANLRADWIAVYVETPGWQRLADIRRQAIFDNLRLAQQLGAETQTLAGSALTDTLLNYARSRNVSKLVVGQARQSGLHKWLRRRVLDTLLARVRDMDVYVVSEQDETTPRSGHEPVIQLLADGETIGAQRRGMGWALALIMLITLACIALVKYVDLVNVVMIYLLGVVAIAARFGRWPGVLASLLSVLAFDFFLIPPRLSFAVSDTQYLLTFGVMLIVALTISNLMAGIRFQAHIARYREQRVASLYDLSKELASALTYDRILEISLEAVEAVFKVRAAILLPDSHEAVRQPVLDTRRNWPEIDLGVAQWTYDHQQAAGLGTDTLPACASKYLPLRAPMRTRGVLVIQSPALKQMLQPEQQRLLETFAAQIALAIERVHYVEVAQDALVSMESERLRNSLLSAISHDLRTPLTVIVGLASSLQGQNANLEVAQRVARDIEDEALKMTGLVSNLLEMARFQSGNVQLHKQWQMIEEVIGSALRVCHRQLLNHVVQTSLPRDLPLVEVDAVLLERVLCNLLENAAKYTPAGSTIRLEGRQDDHELVLSVLDNGPGLPNGAEMKLFEKFRRGEHETSTLGVGLGLAICKAIVEIHQGRIWAENRAEGGAVFHIALPLGTPPDMPEEDSVNA